MTDKLTVGERLKALREEAGLSIRQMAEALDMQGSSTYSHYELRYKKPYLPVDLTQKIAAVLADHGIEASRVMSLAALNPEEPPHDATGFGEKKSPRIDVSALLDEPARPTNAPQDSSNTVKIAIVDDKIQIAATVDSAGFEELIRRLHLARQMID